MKKPLQILLLITLFPITGIAREETLEERKQRIARKYLREEATVAQSDVVVPSDYQEDERITDSKKFTEAEINLEREDGETKPMAVPPPAPRPVPRADANWLLQTTDETAELDMYGNPVNSSIESGPDSWSFWDGKKTEIEKSATRSTDRRYDPYARDSQSSSFTREQPTAWKSRYGKTTSAFGTTDLFGRKEQQHSESTYSRGLGLQSTPRTYGSSPDQGLLNAPYERSRSNDDDPLQNESPRAGTYTPYKSPYQKDREQRSQPSWSTQSSESKNQYQRKDSYQQWKGRQSEWDPTSDDAYINDMMKKNQNRR